MSGRIPPYGKNFRLESLPWTAERSNRAYALKADPAWHIRSDKTSKKWQVYYGHDRETAVAIGSALPSMGLAMARLLDGIELGYYQTEWQNPGRTPQQDGIDSVLACVAGTVYRGENGLALILLNEAPYVVSVNKDGSTASAHLTTVPPGQVADALGASRGSVSGWTPGWASPGLNSHSIHPLTGR